MDSEDMARILKEGGIKFNLISHGPAYSASAASRELNVDMKYIVKAVLFVDDLGTPVLAVVGGDRRVDQGALAKLLGVKGVRLATPGEVRGMTGYEVGALPPLAHLEHIQTVVDAELDPEGVVYAGGGEINNTLEIKLGDVIRFQRARIAKLSRSDR